MRRHLILSLLLLGALPRVAAADPAPEPPPVWITGDVFSEKGVLLFRADKPVQNNPQGRVVLLGASRDTIKVLFPLYAQAAQQHLTLRLFGVLKRFSGTFPGHPGPLPNVEFITWKVHAPSDPDELPADQKTIIGPDDSVKDWKVEVQK